jgi:ATP-dependent Clp protease ATP-binding subunit ClpA
MSDRRTPIGIGVELRDWSKDDSSKEIMKIVKSFLRPEFINRLDEIIIFNRLDSEQFKQIADIMIADLADRLKKLNVELDFPKDARERLVTMIDTANYGARPLKRKLEEQIENPISSLLIQDRHVGMRTARVRNTGQDLVVELE